MPANSSVPRASAAKKAPVTKGKAKPVAGVARKAPAQKTLPRLTPRQVLGYLQAHPGFFEEHRDAMATLAVPAKSGNLLSLHAHKAAKVDKKAETLKTRYTQFVDAARQNAAVTASIHAAVLGALACESVAEFRKYLTRKTEGGLMDVLDLDACHLAHGVDAGEMDLLCPTLLHLVPVDPTLHRPLLGAHISTLKSACLMRLGGSDLLVLGSENPARFHAGQGTEMAEFLRAALALVWGRLSGD